MTENKSRAVVLLSGGVDSCVCAALAARDYDVAALHISYGQRTEERELQSFLGVCERLGIRERLAVCNEALKLIGGSAITEGKISGPRSHTVGAEVPVALVPFRTRQFPG